MEMNKRIALLGVMLLLAGPALAENVTLTDSNLTGLEDLDWGPGSLESTTDIAGDGVEFEITLGADGEGKIAVGKWSGNYADWSAYDGLGLELALVSSSGSGTIETATFLGDKDYSFRQPAADWPVLGVGDSAILYIDFDACWDDSSSLVSIPSDKLNKVAGVGFQVITADPDMLDETIVVRATPTLVPEPASLSLLGLGGLALIRRRRR
jgi:hypothetical protein